MAEGGFGRASVIASIDRVPRRQGLLSYRRARVQLGQSRAGEGATMRASNWSQATHPKFFRYVTVEMPKVTGVPAIAQAMRTHGFLNAAAFRNALSPQQPPLLHLVPNLQDDSGRRVWGYTPPNPPRSLPKNGILPPANSILIDKVLADEFEARTGPRFSNTSADPAVNRRVIKAGSTILHELCHWGDWRAHGRFTDTGPIQEHGEAFEFAVYGALL